MKKEIQWPTDEWLDQWKRDHASEDATDTDADCAWWDLQIEQGNPTPYDLTIEQEQVSKELRKGRAVDAYGKTRKRERKPDEVKREVIATVAQNLPRCWVADGEVKVTEITTPNPEREIRFRIGSDLYSLTLTKHRTPKG